MIIKHIISAKMNIITCTSVYNQHVYTLQKWQKHTFKPCTSFVCLNTSQYEVVPIDDYSHTFYLSSELSLTTMKALKFTYN